MDRAGKILWFLLAGIPIGLCWLLYGVFWCVTIVGIPNGVQCFRLSRLVFFPHGKTVAYNESTGSFIRNLLWMLFSGIVLTVVSFVLGTVFFITIVGIPFGKRCYKLAMLSVSPFGAVIE